MLDVIRLSEKCEVFREVLRLEDLSSEGGNLKNLKD
jgi:hypothetical protein